LRKLLADASRRGLEAKAATLHLLDDFLYGDLLLPMLDVESLKEIRRIADSLPGDQAQFVPNLIAAACHGRVREILDNGSLSLVDAARDALSGKAPRQPGGRLARPGAEPQEVALGQLTIAAAKSEKALSILLSQLRDERRPVEWRIRVARSLASVTAYRIRDKPRIRKQVIPVLDAIASRITLDAGAADRFVWVRAMHVRFLWLTPDGREEALRVVRDSLADHPFELASFLYWLAYVYAEVTPGRRLQIAEAIVHAYGTAFRMKIRNRGQVLNLLCMCRRHLSPERLAREAPFDRAKELIPHGYGYYRPPEEWRAWLERFRKLPVFRGR